MNIQVKIYRDQKTNKTCFCIQRSKDKQGYQIHGWKKSYKHMGPKIVGNNLANKMNFQSMSQPSNKAGNTPITAHHAGRPEKR